MYLVNVCEIMNRCTRCDFFIILHYVVHKTHFDKDVFEEFCYVCTFSFDVVRYALFVLSVVDCNRPVRISTYSL